MNAGPMHPTYLPYSADQLRPHFAIVPVTVGADEERHLSYYRAQIERSRDESLGEAVRAQIEKDERFWTVSALMALFHSGDRVANFSSLMARSGAAPPAQCGSWSNALRGGLDLYFEVGLPSPLSYRRWLQANLGSRAMTPHLVKAGNRLGARVEGPSHVDAVLFSRETLASVHFEAKVLSDCSATVTYDPLRNQLIRNIDVMLERNAKPDALKDREPSLASFVLLTPALFKLHRHSRLYGHLFDRYKNVAGAVAEELPHRPASGLESVADRIGWVTFEDCREVQPDACPWLAPTA